MGVRNPAETRRFERLKLIDTSLPGTLVRMDAGSPIFAVAVDVSKQGLGIATHEQLEKGALLQLHMEDGQTVPLRIVWSKAFKRKSNELQRYGLEVLNPDIELTNLFFAAGRLELDVAFDG